MHFELPEKAIGNVKEFAVHYLMIVLSILTALALEEWLQDLHHRHAGYAAQHEIEAEVEANLIEVKDAYRRNTERLATLEALGASLTRELKAGTPQAVINERVIGPAASTLSVGMSLPTLRREAWEVEVANQSAQYIEVQALRRYAAAYAAQRELSTQAISGPMSLLNGAHMVDTMVDVSVGQVSPRDFLHVVYQLSAAIRASQANLKEIEGQLSASVSSLGANSGGSPTPRRPDVSASEPATYPLAASRSSGC